MADKEHLGVLLSTANQGKEALENGDVEPAYEALNSLASYFEGELMRSVEEGQKHPFGDLKWVLDRHEPDQTETAYAYTLFRGDTEAGDAAVVIFREEAEDDGTDIG